MAAAGVLATAWVVQVHAQIAPEADDPVARATPLTPVSPAVAARDEKGRVTVRATRITEVISIDGRLDEPAYDRVGAVGDFIQQEPREGEPTTEKSEVWVLFDDENLYLSCRCWEAHMDELVANEMRRDVVITGQHDHFAVALDTFHDRRNSYFLLVTAVGGTFDALMTDERTINKDWNAVWSQQVGRFDGGWTVEMAVPFKSLRYRPGRDQTWGIQVRRIIRHNNEMAYLTPMPAAWGMSGLMRASQSATLTDLQVPPPGRNLEIKPFAITDLRTDRLSSPPVLREAGLDAGLDVKYGITKGLTLDLTYNTDFAQVEADEAQINLTRFSLFFPEKREFFLEGQGIFAFGGAGGFGGRATGLTPTLFYSRRIGLSEGREVPIIGGARLTGKAGPYSLGLVNIHTDDEPTASAQATGFTALRLRRDVLGRSNIGVIATHRSNALAAEEANTVVGADALFTFHQFLNISTYVAKSQTPGLRGGDVSYRAQTEYTGDRYGFEVERLVVGDHFNPEIGFMRREDFRQSFALARFSPRPRRANLIRKYTYEASLNYITDNQNTLESRELKGVFQVDLQSGDVVAAEYTRNFELVERRFTISETDGVRIPLGTYDFYNVKGSYQLGGQHRLSGTTALEVGTFYGGDKKTVSFTGRADVTIPLTIEPTISLNWIDLPADSVLTTLISARTTYTMTPRMFVSALVQYTSTQSVLSVNVRFRWEYLPGSELFLVYTEGRDTFPVGRLDLQDRGVVVKINRLLRF